MIVGFVDSGLGALPSAAALRVLRPDLDLVLSMDPDWMPWGPLADDVVAKRALACASAARDRGANAIVMACNTASVLALDLVRAEFEPAIPVIGTVPAIKPAAAQGRPLAVWATAGTTGSAYQARLIADFAPGLEVAQIACPGLAEAIESADLDNIHASVQRAAEETPVDCKAIVLGCTQYPLVRDLIAKALPGDVALFDSVIPVARQTLRRLGLEPAPDLARTGDVYVLLSGRLGQLPPAATNYEVGRSLAAAM